MHTPTQCTLAEILNQQQKKRYSSMSFAAIDPKLFFMINNYASYDEQTFWS